MLPQISQSAGMRRDDICIYVSPCNRARLVALVGAATPQIAYTASKGGVLSMTREIAVEFARKGIRANALCPGPVDTPLLAELMSDPSVSSRCPMPSLGRCFRAWRIRTKRST